MKGDNKMPGNRAGGMKAAKTNRKRYGKDFFRIIGSKGGQAKDGKPKGFAAMNIEKVRAAGRKGGRISRRTGVTNGQGKEKEYVWKGGDDALAFEAKKY